MSVHDARFPKTRDRGPYLTLVEDVNGLYLKPTKEGIEEARERKDNESGACLADMLDHATSEGWSYVNPEDVGALTSADILSEDGFIGNDGKWYAHPSVDHPQVFAFMDYQLVDPVEEFAKGNDVRFVRDGITWTPAYRALCKKMLADAEGD